jgi:hypothetical protein
MAYHPSLALRLLVESHWSRGRLPLGDALRILNYAQVSSPCLAGASLLPRTSRVRLVRSRSAPSRSGSPGCSSPCRHAVDGVNKSFFTHWLVYEVPIAVKELVIRGVNIDVGGGKATTRRGMRGIVSTGDGERLDTKTERGGRD